jgi:hypothetical protein
MCPPPHAGDRDLREIAGHADAMIAEMTRV